MADAAPNWQRGIDLGQLRAMAAPFARRHKALVIGAFGLIKERDIAQAMEQRRVVWTGNPPAAVAIAFPLKVTTYQTDFVGRSICIEPPGVKVSAFAALDQESGCRLLDAVKARAPAGRMLVEIFEEDAIARACVAACGLTYRASRVAAGSEIKGLYGHGMPPMRPIGAEDEVTLAVLDPRFAKTRLAAIRAELAAAGLPWEQHYSAYNKRHSWSAFALRGFSDNPQAVHKPAEMSKAWQDAHPAELRERIRWTPAVERFPATMALLEAFGWTWDRVRFMRLAPGGGELSRHADITDREAGTADAKVTRLHIPIVTSKAVTFYGWDARGTELRQHWPEGALCYLDQRKPHRVTNNDPALQRIHLVADARGNPALRGMIARYAVAHDRSQAVA
jgi:hypothetical protein